MRGKLLLQPGPGLRHGFGELNREGICRLQPLVAGRQTGKPCKGIIPDIPELRKGFYKLPAL